MNICMHKSDGGDKMRDGSEICRWRSDTMESMVDGGRWAAQEKKHMDSDTAMDQAKSQ